MANKLLIGIIVGVVIIGLVIGGIFIFSKPNSTAVGTGQNILIGFSMSTLQEERWQIDRTEFLKKANDLGVSVDIQAAGNDAPTQVSQIESMIAKGVNVLVIAPYDASSLTSVINEAHQAGIKVISYDRLITNSSVDLYLSFDNEKVGQYEAQAVVDALSSKLGQGTKLKIAYIGGSLTDNNAILLKKGSYEILQPLIDKGQIEIVVDKFSPDWKPENAYQNLKTYLDSNNGAIDGVVCANDGTAFGAINALKEHSLDGKVPVSGQDAELAACQRIIQGTQTSTVYKPIPKLASAAAELAITFAKGENVATNVTVNNGNMDVPSVLLEPIAVTKKNINDTVIKDGYHSSKDIYQN
jgi:D-xylose transport system substrate-binding protein